MKLLMVLAGILCAVNGIATIAFAVIGLYRDDLVLLVASILCACTTSVLLAIGSRDDIENLVRQDPRT